jgi:Lrp/AsnC family leucine-responsive transcriptional regulator
MMLNSTNNLRYKNGQLDEIDQIILKSLVEDARTSTAEIARKVGLSPPSVAERIRRLEDAGIITGYTATIDPRALGLELTAWLRIRPIPGLFHKVAGILNKLPAIVECDRITGEDCFIARAHVASMIKLETLIDEVMPYAMTNTSLVQSSPVPRRLPPIPKEGQDS